jgi:phosphatidylserine synthase
VRTNPAAAAATWDDLDGAVARQLEKACSR